MDDAKTLERLLDLARGTVSDALPVDVTAKLEGSYALFRQLVEESVPVTDAVLVGALGGGMLMRWIAEDADDLDEAERLFLGILGSSLRGR